MRPARKPFLRHVTFVVALLLLTGAALWAARGGGAPPAGAGVTGSLAGRVTTERGKRLPEMVVYLELTGSARQFDVPREPVAVSQRDAKFFPSLIVIAVGQSVDFRNDERRPIEHNVFSRTPGSEFDLGLYKPGTPEKVVRFDTPGAVRLYCSIHRYMDGVVYVCPTPLFSQVNLDGTYRIDNVPPGEYRLKTWQRNARFADREVAVKVAGGADAELNLEMSRK
jgi:plastocyanin